MAGVLAGDNNAITNLGEGIQSIYYGYAKPLAECLSAIRVGVPNATNCGPQRMRITVRMHVGNAGKANSRHGNIMANGANQLQMGSRKRLECQMEQVTLIAGGAVVLFFFWKFCRAVVKWGFFTFYFVAGAFLGWYLVPNGPAWTPLASGFAFAWTVTAIKSKLWKAIGAVAVLGATTLLGPMLKADTKASTPKVGLKRADKKKTGEKSPVKVDKEPRGN